MSIFKGINMTSRIKTLFLFIIGAIICANATNVYYRVNQLGYLEKDIKVAVAMMPQTIDNISAKGFSIVDKSNGKKHKVDSIKITQAWVPMEMCTRIYFSSITTPGEYKLVGYGDESSTIRIGNDLYHGAQEVPLYYMRQQRCGYNPSLGDSCHRHDGILVLSGEKDGTYIDVTGGWHDASDYLQYLTTSANATTQMLMAYHLNPDIWEDNFDAKGQKGSNGIADILDEARWGLEWMIKMNPNDTLFLNQIADDRDHRMAVLPADDKVDYGWGEGKQRPVYPCAGYPYGLMGNLNDSKGLASSVGKFSSTFALGAIIFGVIDPDFADELERRSVIAYDLAKANPGACQTAPCTSPYYYEEDNWVDDMELAAAMQFINTGYSKYLNDAVEYGRQEPITPWMGADSAHHYQWYPFYNLGHILLADSNNEKVSNEFTRNVRSGLQRVSERGESNAFYNGIPFIWCSNNLTVAMVTQAMLYRKITHDNQFREMETSMRDWLFGVNPWGKCMIVGLPSDGDYPRDPHSALTNLNKIQVTGGLVDGPVYCNIFKSLKGVHLRNEDKYAQFQNNTVVYHDDYSDYSTNEPTMDGTASTTIFLGILATEAK